MKLSWLPRPSMRLSPSSEAGQQTRLVGRARWAEPAAYQYRPIRYLNWPRSDAARSIPTSKTQ